MIIYSIVSIHKYILIKLLYYSIKISTNKQNAQYMIFLKINSSGETNYFSENVFFFALN